MIRRPETPSGASVTMAETGGGSWLVVVLTAPAAKAGSCHARELCRASGENGCRRCTALRGLCVDGDQSAVQ
jgi:hypothetical protein